MASLASQRIFLRFDFDLALRLAELRIGMFLSGRQVRLQSDAGSIRHD